MALTNLANQREFEKFISLVTYGTAVKIINPDGSTVGGGTAVDNTATTNPPTLTLVGGKYNSTATTYDDGDATILQTDVNGNAKVTLATLLAGEDLTSNVFGYNFKPVNSSTYAPSNYQNNGSVTKANVKASAGNVYSFRITNANATLRYFQIHNKATAPAAADTAARYFLLPAGTAQVPSVVELDLSYFAPSHYCATGIGWAVSTSGATFTDSATASDHSVDINYV